eukprot:SAG22_NODE_5276_length_1047_cov_10.210970_2_plen_75_part_00
MIDDLPYFSDAHGEITVEHVVTWMETMGNSYEKVFEAVKYVSGTNEEVVAMMDVLERLANLRRTGSAMEVDLMY